MLQKLVPKLASSPIKVDLQQKNQCSRNVQQQLIRPGKEDSVLVKLFCIQSRKHVIGIQTSGNQPGTCNICPLITSAIGSNSTQ
uniref:Uncharacterized protein n=1 Tax=Romanomermis culicivorax TaxID=13658 RepID=A0A915ITA4_ROMCU